MTSKVVLKLVDSCCTQRMVACNRSAKKLSDAFRISADGSPNRAPSGSHGMSCFMALPQYTYRHDLKPILYHPRTVNSHQIPLHTCVCTLVLLCEPDLRKTSWA